MSIQIVTALIALIGVLVSVLVSYLTSSQKTNSEIEKLRKEILQDFNVKLFEKRLEVYPELHSYLSQLIKVIQFGTISQETFKEIFEKIQIWDSKNSILFSGTTGLISYELRLKIANILKKNNAELTKEFTSLESKTELRHEIQKLELALKSELGIYAFKAPVTIGEFKDFRSYQEVADSISK